MSAHVGRHYDLVWDKDLERFNVLGFEFSLDDVWTHMFGSRHRWWFSPSLIAAAASASVSSSDA